MIFNNKTKSKFLIITAVIAVLLSVVSVTPVSVYAEEDEAAKSKSKFNKSFSKYIEETEGVDGFLEKLSDEDVSAIEGGDRNNIKYVLMRTLAPGTYLNDVSTGVIASKSEVKKDEILYDGVHACNPKEPLNLINHSCNIPNFTTELVQNVMSVFESDAISNAGKTTAKSTFGFGVPNGVKDVPVSPAKRQQTYTALELYGYDLKFTSYSGEWDRITTSTEARMLTNFGRMDKVKMVGAALWNTVKTTVGTMINGFSFNSAKWIGNILKSYGAGASAGLNTILDTQELNIIATRGWRRDSLSKTLYNVYVLTDKEVAVERSLHVIRSYSKLLEDGANESEALKAVMELSTPPSFTYRTDYETAKSVKARDAVKEQHEKEEKKLADSILAIQIYERDKESMENQEGYMRVKPKLYVMKKKDMPEKKFYTEREQLGFWEDENFDIVQRARKEGVLSAGNADTFATYDLLKEEWESKWIPYQKKEFSVNSKALQDIMDDVDATIFENDFHSDPKRAISHYVCANPDGTPMRDSAGNLEYMYSQENSGSTEYVNPKCSPVRAPIQGGRFGSGWHVTRDKDTRHIDNVSSKSEAAGIPIVSELTQFTTSAFGKINSFIAKLTNVILDFSFAPLLKNLGIDTIIVKMMEGFRDTIFFPMSVMVAAVGAFLLFLQLLKNASALQLVGSVGGTILIFIIGAAFLLTPEAPLKVIDEWPSKMDNFFANIVLSEDQTSDYCSTGGTGDGIRSAQCNVWGAMVFTPWVEAQFGTSYENLYANGYAPQNGGSFNNTNQTLVGNAEVDMGGGVKVNNWAMYQLSKTKAGSITSHDKSVPLGSVDKDMYRLVDLQAGPNGGKKSDARYFDSWMTGGANNVGVIFIATIQSVAMLIAIGGLGIMKIENSFMFALSVLILPIMLLFALTPPGKNKFKSYMSGLTSLLVKRVVITLMLGILLRVIVSVQSTSNSFYISSFVGLAVSSSFIMYKKELTSMIVGTEGGGEQVMDMLSKTVPLSVKQKASMAKAKAKGVAVGVVGGIAGTRAYKKDVNKELNKLDKAKRGLDNKGNLSHYERSEKARIETELNKLTEETGMEAKGTLAHRTVTNVRNMPGKSKEISNKIKSGELNSNDVIDSVVKGTGRGVRDKVIPDIQLTARSIKLAINNAGGMISRREETAIRKQGYAMNTIAKGVKSKIINENADDITHNRDTIAKETYQDISSRLPGGINKKGSAGELSAEDGLELKNPKIQKLVFEEAKKRKDAIKAKEKYDKKVNSKFTKFNPINNKGLDPVHRNSALNKDDAAAATEYLRKQRRNDTLKRAIKKPLEEYKQNELNKEKLERNKNITGLSSAKETKRHFDEKRNIIKDVVDEKLNGLSAVERDSIIEQLMRDTEKDKE